MKVASILFDMDGVIVDSMRLHAAAWRRVLSEYGVPVQDEDIFRREGMPGIASIVDIYREAGLMPPDEKTFRAMLAKKNAMFESKPVRLYPYVRSLISFVKRRGIGIALVTGSPRRAMLHALPAEMRRQFDVVVTADDVTRGKPDPEPYAYAAAALAALRGENTNRRGWRPVCIENSPLGIKSAKAAGAVCFALETTVPRRFLTGADRVFRDHRSLYEFLKQRL